MTTSCPRCGLLHPPGSPCFSLDLSAPRGKGEVQAGTILAGRYRVERTLHHGGMSAVYVATDSRRGVQVALKELRLPDGVSPEEQREAETWFARESFLLSVLQHPLIPAFYGSFREGDRSYIAQEYVEGENLETLVARQGPLDASRVAGWAAVLCQLLEYLHGLPAPVIFRDLKPANIVLRADGRRLAVVDFGIARPYQLGEVGTVIGTPGYAPPEQYQGLATPQSDVYALGATLHRLLTGYDPEHGTAFTFPSICQLNPRVSPALAAIVERAIRINPAERFATAAEMGAALSLLAGGSSVPGKGAARRAGSHPIWLVVFLVGLVLLPVSVIADLRLLRPSLAPIQPPAVSTPPSLDSQPATMVPATSTAIPSATLAPVFATSTPPGMPAVQPTAVKPLSHGLCTPVHGGHFWPLGSMALGPDGSLWFAGKTGEHVLGRITMAGSVTACDPKLADDRPTGVTASGDVVWFGGLLHSEVGYIRSDGEIFTIPLPDAVNGPDNITAGADGSVWVAVIGRPGQGPALEHVTQSGEITEYPMRSELGVILVLATSSDGAVWFEADAGIERLDPSGAVTSIPLPPHSTFSPYTGGSTWYASGDGSAVGQASPEGITSLHALAPFVDPSPVAPGTTRTIQPEVPAIDQAGNVWLPVMETADQRTIVIVEITAGGQMRRYAMPAGVYPRVCVAGPDGAIWFTDDANWASGKIGRLALEGSVREYDAVY